jgi:BlaI family penicillinase repressor
VRDVIALEPDLTVTYVCSRVTQIHSRTMSEPKLTKLELQIMERLWTGGACSIREIQEAFPEKGRPAYTTIQTTVYRLEGKNAVRRVKKVGNFHIFEAAVSRDAAQRRLVDDLLALFGGRTQPVMARLIESGRLTLADVKEAEKSLRNLARKDKPQ